MCTCGPRKVVVDLPCTGFPCIIIVRLGPRHWQEKRHSNVGETWANYYASDPPCPLPPPHLSTGCGGIFSLIDCQHPVAVKSPAVTMYRYNPVRRRRRRRSRPFTATTAAVDTISYRRCVSKQASVDHLETPRNSSCQSSI